MPAIRDYATNYQTSTSGTSVTIPMPAYETGDLLLAILIRDSASAGNFASAGWNDASIEQTAGNDQDILWKIAGASESDVTFTHNSARSGGTIISIMDAHATSPIHQNAHSSLSAGFVQTFGQVTTTVDNCLLIYSFSTGTTSAPTPSLGPVQFLFGADYSSSAQGVGWGFQAVQGTTASNVQTTCYASASGSYHVLAIQPPSGGATIIPTYTSSDSSQHIDLLNGTTAYNNHSAWAATVTTDFGTSLSGITLGNATTVTALADYGVNPYHSASRITGPINKTFYGALLAKGTGGFPDLTGKNILVHIMPSTPKQVQTTAPVGTASLGITFGICSISTSAYKWWHVDGAYSNWGTALAPCIINPDNTTGVVDSAGTLDASSPISFGFAVNSNVTAPIWAFMSLWMLDTIVICGGSSATPIDIPGLVFAVGYGHERYSALQQGFAEMLALQAIQIGDGGTNPVYLDLNNTAIEFPKQYDQANKQVYYCSTDNKVGITYYAGASDTIKHRNSLISSSSKYFWGFNASTSTSATYDFSGTTIIGAGTITLISGISLSQITWSACDGFAAAGAYIDSCIVGKNNSASALTVVSPIEMSRITNTLFRNNTNGHSIEITETGTYTFDNITFTGGGADGSSTADVYNNSGGAVIINITNGGTTLTVLNGSGASTTINNAVTLTVNGVISGDEPTNYVRCRIEARLGGDLSAGTEIMNEEADQGPDADGNYYATTSFNYTNDQPVTIRARYKGYIPFETTGTITSSGLTVTAVWLTDPNFT